MCFLQCSSITLLLTNPEDSDTLTITIDSQPGFLALEDSILPLESGTEVRLEVMPAIHSSDESIEPFDLETRQCRQVLT